MWEDPDRSRSVKMLRLRKLQFNAGPHQLYFPCFHSQSPAIEDLECRLTAASWGTWEWHLGSKAHATHQKEPIYMNIIEYDGHYSRSLEPTTMTDSRGVSFRGAATIQGFGSRNVEPLALANAAFHWVLSSALDAISCTMPCSSTTLASVKHIEKNTTTRICNMSQQRGSPRSSCLEMVSGSHQHTSSVNASARICNPIACVRNWLALCFWMFLSDHVRSVNQITLSLLGRTILCG